MSSTGVNPNSAWHFPEDVGVKPRRPIPDDSLPIPGTFTEEPAPSPEKATPSSSSNNASSSQTNPRSQSRKRRTHWPPRTCRICLETVHPTFSTPIENLASVLQPEPHVSYTSTDPDLGRLLRPCKCKGTSKYVHEGCLQAWRHADPSYGRRNYWQCPTCGYRYRLERIKWAARISNTFTQVLLTGLVFLLALFFMGFVADPVINLYAEPSALLFNPRSITQKIEPVFSEDQAPGWGEHFFKGLASLGLLGFVKVLFSLSPWNWLNIRIGGGSRTGSTGRDRMAQISWFVVLVGVCTFLWVVWKGVQAWSRRTLEKASESVLDIQGDDDDEDEEDETTAAAN